MDDIWTYLYAEKETTGKGQVKKIGRRGNNSLNKALQKVQRIGWWFDYISENILIGGA